VIPVVVPCVLLIFGFQFGFRVQLLGSLGLKSKGKGPDLVHDGLFGGCWSLFEGFEAEFWSGKRCIWTDLALTFCHMPVSLASKAWVS
jgi:hypothetical protein